MSLDRDLRLYELICARMNVSFMLDVVCDLDRQSLNATLNYLKSKHPYLGLKIVKNETGSLRYVEMNDEEKQYVPIVTHNIENEDEFNNWKDNLIKIANVERDFEKSLIFLDVFSLQNSNRHQIFGCINHSGIDGPGMGTVIKDLLHYLDAVLSKTEIQVEPRAFLDIHKEYDLEKYNLETLKQDPVITQDYLPGLKQIPDENDDCDPFVSAEFYQFDEATTKRLVENCRHHKATVQGAISIASLVGLLHTHQQDVSGSVVRVINAAPCNMRGLLKPKLSNDDLVCGSAALIWPQDVKGDDSIWSLVSEATSRLHELRDSMYGYKWWIKLTNSLPLQSYSIMSSSVGVMDLNEKSLKRVTVNDARMLGGSYGVPKNAPGNMTHAITALGRLTVVMSYTYPTLSKQWAKKFAQIQSGVLKYFASFDTSKQEEGKSLKEILDEFN